MVVRSLQLVLTMVLMLCGLLRANGETLQIGVSVDDVPVSSSFAGTKIYVFGSIEHSDPTASALYEYTVLVTVKGPERDLVVRKKEKVLGVWINTHSQTYAKVPGFYTIVSALPVEGAAASDVLKKTHLGVRNLNFKLLSRGNWPESGQPTAEFSEALKRIRLNEELFTEQDGALSFIGNTLFRAGVELPANVPIGRHEVTAYLLLRGEVIDRKTVWFNVQKVGFERWIYELAHKNGLLYGLMAVLLAITTGWIANVLFRRE
ncbi:MAG: TIGR02186 family protein [Rhizobiaceae bacterium]|nr:TIGR02186 family protein [Rhizobiaceae bacterium]